MGAIGLALSVVALVLLTLPIRNPEPEYQGRPLHQWVQMLGSPDQPTATEAATALQRIGTNAIPFLLKWIAYDPHPSKAGKAIANALAGIPATTRIAPIRHWVYSDQQQYGLAEATPLAFKVLGPRASSAVPALARLLGPTQDISFAPRVVDALGNIGSSAMPALIHALTNGNAEARFWSATAMTFMGTNARPAVPALIIRLKDPRAAGAAFHALGALRMEPQLVIPALTNMAQAPDSAIRLYAIVALGGFGPEARPAMPTLVSALQDVDLKVREGATNVLQAVAPEALTNTPAQ